MAQASYGGSAFAEGKTSLSQYAAQLLYKSASEPTSSDVPARPRMPPAAVAGVHLAPTGGEAFAKEGGQLGGSGQRIISYSSEPTNSSTAGLAKFPSESFGRPRNIVPQFSAFDLPPGEFHSVAWVSRRAHAAKILEVYRCTITAVLQNGDVSELGTLQL